MVTQDEKGHLLRQLAESRRAEEIRDTDRVLLNAFGHGATQEEFKSIIEAAHAFLNKE